MFATPTYEKTGAASAVLALVLAALMWIASPERPRAEDGHGFDFFSFLPAKPQLKAPEIDGLAPWADDMKKARRAYRNGEFDKARMHFERASEGGDIVASWYLGHMYRLGRGVEPNAEQAFQYYWLVAEAFTPDEPDPRRLRIMIDALVQVADIYRLGDRATGIKRNPREAFKLYNTAASYGHPSAHFAQGLMTLQGQGVKANPEKALRWLFLAAKKRYAPAEALLGDLYWKGNAVRRDTTRALMWYVLAVQSARPEENPEIFDRYNDLAAQVSEDQRLEAEARARLWAEKYPLPPPPSGAWPESEG